jgi:hypothetical protein
MKSARHSPDDRRQSAQDDCGCELSRVIATCTVRRFRPFQRAVIPSNARDRFLFAPPSLLPVQARTEIPRFAQDDNKPVGMT